MIKIWSDQDSPVAIVDHITDGMSLELVDVPAVCSEYNMELIQFPLAVKAQRANSREIYRSSKSTPREILIVLVEYLVKLRDPNYVILSLTRTLMKHGARPVNGEDNRSQEVQAEEGTEGTGGMERESEGDSKGCPIHS